MDEITIPSIGNLRSSLNFQLLDPSPQRFSASFRNEDQNVYSGENFDDNEENDEDDESQYETITPAAPLPPLYEPTVPPAAAGVAGTASHQQQQQSVRYIDEHGNYISDQDIAQFVHKLRQQLLQNLITLLSSALQTNAVV